MPPLLPENEDTLKIYGFVKGQVIVGMDGPIDINQLAIWKIIENYGIKDPIKAFEKVVNIGRHFLNEQHKQTKGK